MHLHGSTDSIDGTDNTRMCGTGRALGRAEAALAVAGTASDGHRSELRRSCLGGGGPLLSNTAILHEHFFLG